MSNLIKRTVPVILVLALCFTCLVSPASAATGEIMYDLLDYSTLNDTGSNYVKFTQSSLVSYAVTDPVIFRYIDMTISMVGALSDVYVGNSSTNMHQLTAEQISGSLYRVYGSIPSMTFSKFWIKFESGSDSTSWYTIHSLKVCNVVSNTVPTIGRLVVSDYYGRNSDITMSSPDEEPEVYFRPLEGTIVNGDYVSWVYLSDWKRFDYIDVQLYINAADVTSLSVEQGDLFLEHDVSFIGDNDEITSWTWIVVRVDLSSCDRSSANAPVITLSGHYFLEVDISHVRLQSIRGIVTIPEPSPLLAFWTNLKSFFSSNFNTLFSKIDEAFGLNDESASNAVQTQEEINVSINNQLVGAVEDWNTHIEVVQTGYDSALTKATPALGWLASLADRVFTNMGWFGNIYFLIGLISVIMLVLSKSGLARSVGRIRRND